MVAKDRAASRFLGYLDEVGAGDLAALGVRDVSGFLLRQRGLRRKAIAAMRSCLADFLEFLATAGRTPRSLAGRLPPHRHVRHESEPHLWTADEIRRVLAVIDRQSATGKRDYAMILATARLGLRISDLRRLELVLIDPTQWQPGQAQAVPDEHRTGVWEITKFSGAVSRDRKAQLTENAEALLAALRQARERANHAAAPAVSIGREVFAFLLG